MPANYCARELLRIQDRSLVLSTYFIWNLGTELAEATVHSTSSYLSSVAMDYYWSKNDTKRLNLNNTLTPTVKIASSWLVHDDVVKFNGTVQNPIHLNPIILVWNFVACFAGIPLNLMIVVFILSLRRLRRKSRNVFSLGLILSNLSTFVPVITEFTYFHFPEDEICLAYVAVVGLPCVLFMANALMSLCDRYAAICRPLWHRRRVTVPFAVCAQLFGSLLIAILYKGLYVFQAIPLRCEIKISQV
jgi:hypothetical protein